MGVRQVKRFESYNHPGHNYRRAVSKPDSWFRKMHWELHTFGTVTRKEFFVDWKPEIVEDGKVRPGWGTDIFTGLKNAGLIQITKYRRDGYPVYDKGPEWDYWNRLVLIATWGPDTQEDETLWETFQTPGYLTTEWDYETPHDVLTKLDGTQILRKDDTTRYSYRRRIYRG